MRKCPSPTGFFKIDNLFGELLTEAHKSIARKNLGINKLSYNSDEIWIGDTPPENTDQLWLEPSQDEYINQEGNLSAIRQSIYQLQQQMNKVIQLIQYGVIAGDSSCGGRTQMMNEEIINPETGEVQLIEPIKLKGTVPNISIKCDTQANFALNKNNLIDGVGALGQQPTLMVANILAPIIINMLSDVEKVLPVGKTFICSGIVDHEKDAVVQALNAHHFTVTEVKEKNGWVAIVAIYNGCKQ